MMPRDLLEANPWEKGTKMRVKEWVKDNVGRRGEDMVLWGRWEAAGEAEEGECVQENTKGRKKQKTAGVDETNARAGPTPAKGGEV